MKVKKMLIPGIMIVLIILILSSCAMHPICPAYAKADMAEKEQSV